MRTEVTVHFNGAYFIHIFNMDEKGFMQIWKKHITEVGYFELADTEGTTVIISPSNCGMVEIKEINY